MVSDHPRKPLSSGTISKFRCRGCGYNEYVLTAEGFCTSCQMHGPPWRKWLWAIVVALLIAYVFSR